MLAMSVEDQLQRDLAQASEDSGSEDESDALPLEWENVSSLFISHLPHKQLTLSCLIDFMKNILVCTGSSNGRCP